MSRIHLADGLSLPLDIVTQTVAILAKRRAGKSYTARRIAEQLLRANQQVVIVDPKGDHWGIRSAGDGRSPGFSVTILGGERGDLPLEVESGPLVAKLAAEDQVNLLLDLSLFSKRQVAIFMAGFLEGLYRLKAREIYRTPVMLIVDEADAIAPQKPQAGEERMLGAADDIVRRGGQRGIGCTLVTQRSAVLNKNVLTQAQVLVVLRTIAPQDIKAMEAWIEVHGTKEQGERLIDSLPSLPIGDAWFWSPGWPTETGIFKRVHVLPIETFDSGATPKPGERRVEPKNVADVDLEVLKKQMAATIEKAKREDPKLLQRRIAELERENAQIARAAVESVKVETKVVERSVVKPADLKRVEVFLMRGEKLSEKLIEASSGLLRELDGLEKAIACLNQPLPPASGPVRVGPPYQHMRAEFAPGVARPDGVKVRETKPFVPPARRGSPSDAAAGLPGAEQKILDALAELEALGVSRPERPQVALLSGYTHLNSKGLVNGLGSLRSAGLIDYPEQGRVCLTDPGRAQARFPDAPRTSVEIQERVLGLLGGVTARVLSPLIESYPKPLHREEVARQAGYGHLNSKGFVNTMGRLRSLGFIDYPSTGMVVARSVLFMEGR